MPQDYEANVSGRLLIQATLECRDKDGNLLQTIPISGGVSLDHLGMTPEQAQQFIQEASGGTDIRA